MCRSHILQASVIYAHVLLLQRIEAGLQPVLPPPVDNPFASLPRVSPSRGAAAGAEASTAAAEHVSTSACLLAGLLCAASCSQG
jgi:hypothetical protein